LEDFSVDKSFLKGLEIGLFLWGKIFIFREAYRIYYKETDSLSYLGCSQPYAIAMIHGLEHILYELVKRRIIFWYCITYFSKDGVSIGYNR